MTAEEKKRLLKIASEISGKKFGKKTSVKEILDEIDKKAQLLRKKSSSTSREITNRKKRISEIVKVLMAVSALDFTKRAPISKKLDDIDGLSAGINMMAEELKSSTVSLKEKETLLKEIHHRVKNNLQLIQSLLNIQSSFIKDESALEKFKESMDRVHSMALIHEKLYLSTNLDKIDFTEYLKSLVSQLFVSYNANPDKIKVVFNTEIEHRFLDINTAIPCGLMVNEILTNSFKYAFPKNKSGEITVSYESQKIKGNKRKNCISIIDNGVGLPKNFSLENSLTLGMQLITTLLEQIEGKMEIKNNKGTGFIVSFITED